MGDHGIERDMDKAVYWLERATKQNAVRPMIMLGCCYQDNTYGIANGERALYWFNRAIEAGDYSCYSNIGNMYASGLVLGKDIDKAVSYWTKAAECGCVDAQEYLSFIYRKADIVPENPQLAFFGLISQLIMEVCRRRLTSHMIILKDMEHLKTYMLVLKK